jgi:hypothetical protein
MTVRDGQPDISETSRRTLRLTFRASPEGVELMSVERLNIITPPQPGLRPQARTHTGHWVELRDADGRVLAHRRLNQNLIGSVEVHSPDGAIERRFGPVQDTVFEVLLPDVPMAEKAVVVGEPLDRAKERPRQYRAGQKVRSGDIAEFKLPQRGEEGGR